MVSGRLRLMGIRSVHVVIQGLFRTDYSGLTGPWGQITEKRYDELVACACVLQRGMAEAVCERVGRCHVVCMTNVNCFKCYICMLLWLLIVKPRVGRRPASGSRRGNCPRCDERRTAPGT